MHKVTDSNIIELKVRECSHVSALKISFYDIKWKLLEWLNKHFISGLNPHKVLFVHKWTENIKYEVFFYVRPLFGLI